GIFTAAALTLIVGVGISSAVASVGAARATEPSPARMAACASLVEFGLIGLISPIQHARDATVALEPARTRAARGAVPEKRRHGEPRKRAPGRLGDRVPRPSRRD